MKLFSGKRLRLVFSSLLSVLVSGSLWTYSISASDLPQPQFVRRSTALTFIEDLDIEYVTANGSSGTFTLTGTLSFPDGEIVTADPVYYGTCLPVSGTSVSANQQSCSLTPRVNGVNTTYGHHASTLTFDESDTTLTLTGSTPSQVVSMKYSYALVQRVFIGFDRPAVGYFDVDYSVNSGRSLSTYRQPYSDSSVYLPNWSSGTASFRAYGTPVVQVDFIEYHFGESSMNFSPFITWDSNSFKNYTEAYEAPVSDDESHGILQNILNAILNNEDNGAAQQQVNEIKDTAENKMGGITDATELVEQGLENLQGDAVNKLTFPGLFGGDSWTLDLGYIEQQAPELVGIMRTMLIAAVAWGCYEMLKNTVLGNRV